MSVKVKAFLFGCIPFVVAAMVALACPAIRAFDIDVHGWAPWLVIFGTVAVTAFSEGFFDGFLKGLLNVELKHPVVRIAKSVGGWLCVAFGIWLASVIVPGGVSVTAPLGGIAVAVLIGVAGAFSDMIEERVKASASSGTK